MDITDALAPASDQLDAVELVNPRTFTIDTGSKLGTRDGKTVAEIRLADFPRVWRPSKGMLDVLAACWGTDGKQWAGRSLTLYCDPNVMFGPDKVGGIRISHLSHIDKPRTLMIRANGVGRKKPWHVEPLADAPTRPVPLSVEQRIEMAVASFASIGISVERLEVKLGARRDQWGGAQVVDLGAWYTAITRDGVDAESLLPEVSRQSASPAPAVEDVTAAPGGAAVTSSPVEEVGSEQRLPISSTGASVVNGVKANLRRGQLAAIEEDFARLLGAPVDPEEVLWWSGLIVAHPVAVLADLGTEDLRKLQSRLNRLRDREQLEAELGLKGGE